MWKVVLVIFPGFALFLHGFCSIFMLLSVEVGTLGGRSAATKRVHTGEVLLTL